MSDSEDAVSLPDESGGDLFGDDDNQAQSDQDGGLSDRELGSEPDEGESRARDDGVDDAEEDQEVQMKRIMGVTVHRHRTPRTKDGFLQSMKVPYFLKFQAEEYKPETFEPSEWDIQNARSDKRKNVVRFQRDPETGELKSNAAIYRWSDGSLSMSVGSDHYEIQKKSMAPPAGKPQYEERDDAHYYVAAAHITSELFLTVGHVSEQYTVNLSSTLQDEATLKFNRAMAEAARARNSGAGMIITTTKNPELQKREAELAEKEQLKAQRRRETAAARLDGSRAGAYKSGGLSIGDLESGRRAGGPRKRGVPGSSKGKRRRPEYDSDDDFPSGGRRQNEYDREDDFIAPSDEEGASEEEEEEEEEEDILDDDDDDDEGPPRKKRQKTADAEDDADADADLDDVDAPAPAAESSRVRRRRVVDEDEDEDDE
ncbi:Leo1-like protein-domain-containing protein [Durotheca rogersii]|uniref:Leo1-like protein-domain-containing protein n=1 Tax=Durotheca rogersii TaxID=419775 RepID=UPI00222018E2|nr:Leo1-like protein-domain-containing protein [Durotheca rogersii]KAI5862207.1 Leo1-like protein-domain-containing protein [Durotheca rogersii]